MTLRRIIKARRKIRITGPPADRDQVLRSLIRTCQADLRRLDGAVAGIVHDFQRWYEGWLGERAPATLVPHAIATDLRAARMYWWSAAAALLLEAIVAGFFFARNELDWRFGVGTMVLVTVIVHAGVFYVVFGSTGWVRPKETHANLRWFVVPSLVLLLVALVLAILPRYVTGLAAADQRLHNALSAGLLAGSVSLLVLAASWFCAALIWSTSRDFERRYRALIDEQARTADFIDELREQISIPAESSEVPAPAPAVGRGLREASTVSALLLAAVLAGAACSPPADAAEPADPAVAAEPCGTGSDAGDRADAGDVASCEVEIDISGSIRDLPAAWSAARSHLATIAEQQHCGVLKVSTFDTDGWVPKRVLGCRLPALHEPEPVKVRSEWSSAKNVRDAEAELTRIRREAAARNYRAQLTAAVAGLDQARVLPASNQESRSSDVAGALRRYAEYRGQARRVVLVVSDFGDTGHRALPQIDPPAGNIRVVAVIAPMRDKEAKLLGLSLESADQFRNRRDWLARGAPWVTGVPTFASPAELAQTLADRASAGTQR
jgi:hypothetical protein